MLDFINEFWAFLRVRKKYWLLPLLFMFIVLGGLLALTGGRVAEPFVYNIF